jgi:ribonuclease BN (tRNA processing enzyme)
MIEVMFLGVGEAFDDAYTNTSLLIRFGKGRSIVSLLLECGATAPSQLWREMPKVDDLDSVWISHFHADHTFGLPALLVRSSEERRKKTLTVLGQQGIESFVRRCLDLAYPGFYKNLSFPIRYVEVEPAKEVALFGLTFRTAENHHSQRDLAMRIDFDGKSVYYSGDGKASPECMTLAKGCQLIIHESFLIETEIHGHGTVMGSIDMAQKCEVPNLALVHIQRRERKDVIKRVEKFAKSQSGLNVMVPEPGDKFTI